MWFQFICCTSPPTVQTMLVEIDQRNDASFLRQLEFWNHAESVVRIQIMLVFFKWFHISILTFCIIWCKSCGGFTHEAVASQKNIKSGTTPAGLTVIIWHMPRNAESFSSLSLIWRKEVHLYQCKQKQLLKLKIEPD